MAFHEGNSRQNCLPLLVIKKHTKCVGICADPVYGVGRLDCSVLLGGRDILLACSSLSGWTPGLRWNAAEHSFHLVPETLVYQSVSKRIDGGIDHNHHMRDGNCNWAELVRANVIHDMEYGMCTPGNTKYSTYDYHCQSDSLANLQHTLYTGDNYTVKFIRQVDLKTVRTWDIAS